MTWGNMGTLKVLPGKRDELIAILTRYKPELKEAGCLLYEVGCNESEPDLVYVCEVWRDAEGHRASLGMGSVREGLHEAIPLLDGDMLSLKFGIVGSPLEG